MWGLRVCKKQDLVKKMERIPRAGGPRVAGAHSVCVGKAQGAARLSEDVWGEQCCTRGKMGSRHRG